MISDIGAPGHICFDEDRQDAGFISWNEAAESPNGYDIHSSPW